MTEMLFRLFRSLPFPGRYSSLPPPRHSDRRSDAWWGIDDIYTGELRHAPWA